MATTITGTTIDVGPNKLVANSAGNVGINTASPTSPLHITGSGHTAVTITGGASSDAQIRFGDSANTTIGMINYDNAINALKFVVNGSTAAIIDNGGRAIIGGGITLGNGSTYAAANTLDDYEEGTWTPAYTSGSSGYSSQQGKYTKIGEQVTAYFMLQMNNNQVGGSTLQVGGLPFTSNSHPSYGASSGIHCNNWSTSAKKPDNGLVSPNSTNIDLYHSQGTTGTTSPLGTDIGTGSLIGCVVYRTSS